MGMTEAEREFAASLQRLIGAAGERADYLRSVHADLEQRGQLGRYAVHRYMCPRGDQLAMVVAAAEERSLNPPPAGPASGAANAAARPPAGNDRKRCSGGGAAPH